MEHENSLLVKTLMYVTETQHKQLKGRGRESELEALRVVPRGFRYDYIKGLIYQDTVSHLTLHCSSLSLTSLSKTPHKVIIDRYEHVANSSASPAEKYLFLF